MFERVFVVLIDCLLVFLWYYFDVCYVLLCGDGMKCLEIYWWVWLCECVDVEVFDLMVYFLVCVDVLFFGVMLLLLLSVLVSLMIWYCNLFYF